MIWFSVSVLKHDSQWGRSAVPACVCTCVSVCVSNTGGRTRVSKAANARVICRRKTTSFSCRVGDSEWTLAGDWRRFQLFARTPASQRELASFKTLTFSSCSSRRIRSFGDKLKYAACVFF